MPAGAVKVVGELSLGKAGSYSERGRSLETFHWSLSVTEASCGVCTLHLSTCSGLVLPCQSWAKQFLLSKEKLQHRGGIPELPGQCGRKAKKFGGGRVPSSLLGWFSRAVKFSTPSTILSICNRLADPSLNMACNMAIIQDTQ